MRLPDRSVGKKGCCCFLGKSFSTYDKPYFAINYKSST